VPAAFELALKTPLHLQTDKKELLFVERQEQVSAGQVIPFERCDVDVSLSM
jgi:hypothetical protein